jgi:hypothetical protein
MTMLPPSEHLRWADDAPRHLLQRLLQLDRRLHRPGNWLPASEDPRKTEPRPAMSMVSSPGHATTARVIAEARRKR